MYTVYQAFPGIQPRVGRYSGAEHSRWRMRAILDGARLVGTTGDAVR